jgi:DNA repair protein RecN (Recombination protein N)
MLTCLRIRNVAVVDGLELELARGLNVVTGDTGAGKSILIDALGLVLGGRATAELVRTGAREAEVEALFDLEDAPEVRARLEAAGIDADDELVVRRVVRPGGRARAYVNGRLATAAELERLVAGLVDVTSQHEHHTLTDPARQLELLDAFGRLGEERAEVARAGAALSEAALALRDLEARARRRSEREELLRAHVAEIDAIGPQPGEDCALEEEQSRLRHAEVLARAAGGAEGALYAEDGSASETLGRVAQELWSAARFDARLGALAEAVDGARASVEDAARELGAYARAVALDPARLAEVEERHAAIKRLLRKHGGTIEAVRARRDEDARELAELEACDERLGELVQARDAAYARASEAARALSTGRGAAAKKLGRAVARELASLGMGGARVDVALSRLSPRAGELEVDGAYLGSTGIDKVELLFAPNPGEEARSLRRTASGGELSRALLSVKRVLAGLAPAGAYVFDEVDAGVGGAIAEVIGKKLRDVARHHQVLCITHLPQIAVFADAHFHVEKNVVRGRTRSEVRALDADARVDEIARMLGGVKVTRTTRAAAAELLAHARAA